MLLKCVYMIVNLTYWDLLQMEAAARQSGTSRATVEETLVVTDVEVRSQTRRISLATAETGCDVSKRSNEVGASSIEVRRHSHHRKVRCNRGHNIVSTVQATILISLAGAFQNQKP